MEDAHQHEEFTDEPGRARQADVGHCEEQEDQRESWHPVYEAAVGIDFTCVHPVVDNPDQQEQRTRDKAVADHLKDRAVDTLLVDRKDTHCHVAHVGDG